MIKRPNSNRYYPDLLPAGYRNIAEYVNGFVINADNQYAILNQIAKKILTRGGNGGFSFYFEDDSEIIIDHNDNAYYGPGLNYKYEHLYKE